ALVEQAELAVGEGGGLLDGGESVDEVRILGDGDAGDGEVLDSAQGLDAVVLAVGDLAFAEQVLLEPQLAGQVNLLAAGQAGVGGGQAGRDDLGRGDGEPGVERGPLVGDARDRCAGKLDGFDGFGDVSGCRVRIVVQQRALGVGVAGTEQREDLVMAAVPLANLDPAADQDAELAAGLVLAEDVCAGQVADD